MNIDSFFNSASLLSGMLAGISAFWAWLRFRKWNDRNTESKLRKETTINDIENDKAIYAQIDNMMSKVLALSDTMIKMQYDAMDKDNKLQSYKSFVHRLKLLCDDICKESEICKGNIDRLLNDLNLRE